MRKFRVSWATKPPLMRALHCGRQRVLNYVDIDEMIELLKDGLNESRFPQPLSTDAKI